MPSPVDNARQFYDRHSGEYAEKWGDHDLAPESPANVYRRNMVAELVDHAQVREGQSVVEIGAGTGLVLRELLTKTRPVVGTDVSIEMLRRAQEIFSKHARVELVDRLPESLDGADLWLMQDDVLAPKLTGSYDSILSMEVFRYVGDLDTAFANVRNLLLPGGVFAFTVTNLLSLSLFPARYELRRRLGRVDPEAELAQYFVTEQGIRKTLERAGFEIVALRRLNALAFNPLVRKVVRTPGQAARVTGIDRRLESVPGVNQLFDTLLIAARQTGSSAPS
jgi:predicted TPR repeat methyltransferase